METTKQTYFVARDYDSEIFWPTIVEVFTQLTSAKAYAELMEKAKGGKYIILTREE